MKKLLSVILALSIFLAALPLAAMPVFAASASVTASGTTGDCTWTLDGTVLTISGNGKMADYSYYSSSPWGNAITEVIIENGVTQIGSRAFYNCDSLISVTIGYSVTSIGDDAFHYCPNLTSINIPDGVVTIGNKAFYCCTNLTTVNMGNTVTSIGGYAFSYCSNLISINIPDSVTTIGFQAFIGCKGLADSEGFVIIRDVLYEYYGEENSVTIPDSVTCIGDQAFYWRTSLTSITIPDNVTTIGYSAFECCLNLVTVNIGNSVTSIGNNAFYDTAWYNNQPDGLVYAGKVAYKYKGDCPENVIIRDGTLGIADQAFYFCSSLTSVTIPDSVTNIGDNAFAYCTSLSIVNIPDNVTSIGYYAFGSCSNLTSINIPASVINIGSSAFGYCSSLSKVNIEDLSVWCNIDFEYYDDNPLYYAKNLYLNGELVNDLVIPDGVTEIKDYAFYYCSSITSVTIPDSVTSIGDYAFENCSALTSVTIGDGVTSIGVEAFYKCNSLISVDFGESLTSIGKLAFFNCSKLNKVNIKNIAGWCNIDFESNIDNPLSYAENLYLNGELVTDLVIPDGVTEIKDYAFYNCSSITSVTIPDSVTSIGDYAFYYCSALTSVTIGDGVTSIGVDAFYYCSYINNVNITDLSAWCNIDYESIYANPLDYGRNLYLNGELVTDLIIPDDVTEIKDYAFIYCSSITSVTIPDSVTSIGEFAFYGCSKLTSITIGDNVTSIGDFAFNSSGQLISITVAENNQNYCSVDGILFNKDKTELILYPAMKNDEIYYIPDSVISITDYAFEMCHHLTSIILPDSVISIGDSAFEYCRSLTSITIGDSVVSIGNNAFYDTAWYNNQPDGLVYAGKVAYKYKGYCPENVIIRDGTLGIADQAFYLCSSLTSVTIPDSVICVGNGAFYNTAWYDNQPDGLVYAGKVAYEYKGDCPESVIIKDGTIGVSSCAFGGIITSITLPTSVVYIGETVFWFYDYLTEIYYRGSETDKEKIIIESDNDTLLNATWHFNSCINSAKHITNCESEACDTCGAQRTPTEHVYDNNSDPICDECSYIRCIIGDCNGDGNIDTTDLANIKLFLAAIDDMSDVGKLGADLNGDGSIDTTDLAMLKMKLAGL